MAKRGEVLDAHKIKKHFALEIAGTTFSFTCAANAEAAMTASMSCAPADGIPIFDYCQFATELASADASPRRRWQPTGA